MSKFYSGDEHIYFNENGTIVTIKPLDGQTLNIEGTSSGSAGLNTEVMFNDSGDLAGEPEFTYDKNFDILNAVNHSGDIFLKNILGDPLGYNELYQPKYLNPQL